MAEEDYDNLRPDEIDAEIDKKYTELLDMNSAVIQASRQMARDVLRIKDVYLMLAEKCVEIAELHAVGARQTADLTGDLLSNEWGLVELLGEDDDEDFEDDE
jgi:hypothetical protein